MQYDPSKHEFCMEQLGLIRFRVDRFLLMPKHEAWLRREAFIRQAYTSSMIENASISEEELAKAESDLTIERPDVANYATALDFVDYMSSHADLNIDEQVIRQIHWLLMRGVRDDHFLPGSYRKTTNWIEEAGVRVYQPPHALDIPPLMRDFIMQIRDPDIDPVLKAGLAHIHLVAIHPFVDGNGRTARLLATLLLQSSGWGFRNLLSLDHYYQRNRDDYIAALKDTLGTSLPVDYDVDRWLDFFCMSVLLEATRLEERLTEWQMMLEEVHASLKPTGLSDRQIDGLVYTGRKGQIARREYAEIAGISPLTATRDLVDLVSKGILRVEGQSRNRIYKLIKEIRPIQVNATPTPEQPRMI